MAAYLPSGEIDPGVASTTVSFSHPGANAILREIHPQFSRLATEHLDQGFRLEFWDEPFGRLGDKTEVSGTDSDIAIAYYNHADELCLWLIEHKLTEAEFTSCGGYKSRGRKPLRMLNARFKAG